MMTAHVNEMGIVLRFEAPGDNLSSDAWESLLDELKSHYIPSFYQYGKRICQPLLTWLCAKIATTSRLLYVYQVSDKLDDWKYYTSETTGTGRTGDDIIWTLVSWPRLGRKDSFRLTGVVGMVNAIHESQAKLLGRWDIAHNPDRPPIGLVPACGLRSRLRRASAKALQFLGSI